MVLMLPRSDATFRLGRIQDLETLQATVLHVGFFLRGMLAKWRESRYVDFNVPPLGRKDRGGCFSSDEIYPVYIFCLIQAGDSHSSRVWDLHGTIEYRAWG